MDESAEPVQAVDVDRLHGLLIEARRRGLVGGGDERAALIHAQGFAGGVDEPPARLIDLGSGGGLPGLVLALEWPGCAVTLLDGSQRSTDFLTWAVRRLGLAEQVRVLTLRAELAGRDPALRGTFDAVTARGFGPPATTAECAAPLLTIGGLLVVSEPPPGDGASPGEADRWPVDGLRELGLEPSQSWSQPYHYRSFRQRGTCPERFPRRVGLPRQRPLF